MSRRHRPQHAFFIWHLICLSPCDGRTWWAIWFSFLGPFLLNFAKNCVSIVTSSQIRQPNNTPIISGVSFYSCGKTMDTQMLFISSALLLRCHRCQGAAGAGSNKSVSWGLSGPASCFLKILKAGAWAPCRRKGQKAKSGSNAHQQDLTVVFMDVLPTLLLKYQTSVPAVMAQCLRLASLALSPRLLGRIGTCALVLTTLTIAESNQM